MTRIIEAGPLYSKSEFNGGPGYRDDRGADDIERELRTCGVRFSFEQTLKVLRALFPHQETIKVFEGGCGAGNLLRDISLMGKSMNINVETVGITLADEDKPMDKMQEAGLDALLIGEIKRHHRKRTLGKGYHLILDFYGALWYEPVVGCFMRDYSQEGQITLPIYRSIAVPGGFAAMLMRGLDPDITGVLKTAERDKSLKYIRSQFFRVIENKKRFVFAQREAETLWGALKTSLSPSLEDFIAVKN